MRPRPNRHGHRPHALRERYSSQNGSLHAWPVGTGRIRGLSPAAGRSAARVRPPRPGNPDRPLQRPLTGPGPPAHKAEPDPSSCAATPWDPAGDPRHRCWSVGIRCPRWPGVGKAPSGNETAPTSRGHSQTGGGAQSQGTGTKSTVKTAGLTPQRQCSEPAALPLKVPPPRPQGTSPGGTGAPAGPARPGGSGREAQLPVSALNGGTAGFWLLL